MREPVLVIMAAGMGSRFGGLKQITSIDNEGHKIIDYSLYDAKRAGFRKVVFIIKHEIEQVFKEEVGSRVEEYFDVRYAFQEVDKIPEGYTVPEGRVKPWGTGHAIACAADQIDGPFAVINSDDYYGPKSMQIIYDFLKEEREANEHAMVGYLLRNTVTENGSVSRGVCEVEDGFLTNITERTKIIKKGQDAAYTLDDENYVDLSGDTVVSMNLWGFQQEILTQFVSRFQDFLDEQMENNPMRCEYYLPTVANAQIQEGIGSVTVLTTDDVWHGITYMEDLQTIKDAMAGMKEQGLYPTQLWMKPAAAYHFAIDGAPYSMEPYGCGHINRTYLLTTTIGKRYILQKISDAFDVDKLMHNISSVISYIKENADPRKTMGLVYDLDGNSYYTCAEGNYRVFDYVEDSYSIQIVEKEEDFYNSALAFGNFQDILSDFPAETLMEPIPDFHNTIDRYRIFKETIARDPEGRVKDLQPEIDFVLAREEEGGVLHKMRMKGELPVRVTHNDTKLNNVLFDNESKQPICVVDLDTVMPGLSLYDYGDAIRFGASTALEDEQNLDKVDIDLNLFETFTRGYLEACQNLTDKEIEMMPMGAKIMTLECGLRFLTDHIDGDHYFSIHRANQNLDRARTQFKLVKAMEDNWDQMREIVKKLAK